MSRIGRHLEGRDQMIEAVSRLEGKIAEARIGSCCQGVWASMLLWSEESMLERYVQVGRLCASCQVHLLLTLAATTDPTRGVKAR